MIEPNQSDDERQETPHERLDRNLEELTGELRVIVTGVQVLFAFLLIVPFNTGFAGIGDFERNHLLRNPTPGRVGGRLHDRAVRTASVSVSP